MAYLTSSGHINSSDPNNPDVPELGNMDKYITYIEKYIRRAKEIYNSQRADGPELSQFIYDFEHGITETMLLINLNVYLYRINNFYDYKNNVQPLNPLIVYDNVLRGEMKTIWDPQVKVNFYEKIFNVTNPEGLNILKPSYINNNYQGRGLEYQQNLQIIHGTVSVLLKMNNEFYSLVSAINKKGVARTRPLTTDDCINFSSRENFNMLNPHSFVQTTNISRLATDDIKKFIISYVDEYLANKAEYIKKIDVGGRFNVDRNKNIIIDNTWYDVFFKYLNDDLKLEKDLFARFALYTGIIREQFSSLFDSYDSNLYKSEIIKICRELSSIMERYIEVVKRITFQPTTESVIAKPNTVFKRSNYLEAINSNPTNGNFYREVTTTRGKPASLESLIREINKRFGLRLHDLVSLNPLINNKHVIPIFGCDTSNTDYFIGDPYYDPERKIVNGTENDVYSLLNPFEISLQSDNYRISKGVILGSYSNGRFELNEKNKVPGDFLNTVRELLNTFQEYLNNDIRSNRKPLLVGDSNTASGEPLEARHMSLMGFAEIFIRYIMSREKMSSISFLRYEVLSKELLQALNRDCGTNFPFGTKFLYIDIRHGNLPNHGLAETRGYIPAAKLTSTAANYTDGFARGENTLTINSSFRQYVWQQANEAKYKIFVDLANSLNGLSGRESIGENGIAKLCDFLLSAFLVFVNESQFKLTLRSDLRNAYFSNEMVEYLAKPIWDELAFYASRSNGQNVNVLNVF